MTNTIKSKNSGFTIVELLIVIVVIAILAAISIVAYSGIQNRAKTSSGEQLAAQVEKKAQAYYTVKGLYPLNAAAFTDAEAKEAELEGNVTLLTAEVTQNTADNGNAVGYEACDGATAAATAADVTGVIISYWDFASNPQEAKTKVLGTATC